MICMWKFRIRSSLARQFNRKIDIPLDCCISKDHRIIQSGHNYKYYCLFVHLAVWKQWCYTSSCAQTTYYYTTELKRTKSNLNPSPMYNMIKTKPNHRIVYLHIYVCLYEHTYTTLFLFFVFLFPQLAPNVNNERVRFSHGT